MRTLLTRTLSGLGVLLVLCGLLAGVANREVLDGDRFARHVDVVRADPAVSRLLGVRISDAVIDRQPELVSLRPLLESAAATVVASDALGPVVRSTIAPLHRALVSGSDDDVLLRLADVGVVLLAALNTLDPDAAVSLPDNLDVTLAEFSSRELTAGLIRTAHLVSTLAWLLPLLGALCVAGAALARRREERAGLVQRALYWVAGLMVGLVLLLDLVVSRLDSHDLPEALAAAAWGELSAAVWRSAALVVVVALLVAVVTLPSFRLSPRGVWSALHAWYSVPHPDVRTRLARGAVSALGAVALLTQPLVTVTAVLGVLGLLVLAHAAKEWAAALAQAARAGAPRITERVSAFFTPRTALLLSAALVVGVVVVGAWPQRTQLPLVSSDQGTACNGHDSLCERRYDEVTFAATHNSMSAADGPGWFLAEQPTGVMGQLRDGIRVFLIDSWPGQQTRQRGVVANSTASRENGLTLAREELGSEAVEAALRLRGALDLDPSGPVRPYLCHALCELGSTDWVPLMRQVRAWMDAHPREVVTFYIEDYVTPAETVQVFTNAGLLDLVHTQKAGEPWPTLAEMIDSGRRLVVFNQTYTDPQAPWLMHGEGMVQDTPYDFTAASQFRCTHNRGPRDASLLLVNHWLNNYTSRIADADRVNARKVLLPRLETCAEERKQRVNWVAVNNYDRGDVLAVVDELNGV